MSRAFAITVSPDSLSLRGGEAKKVTFTVTNNLSAPIRARVRAVPVAPLEASWLEVSGESELEIEGTEQVTVTVRPPTGAPVGSGSFRLDVISIENPDEDFTEGPAVAVAIQPSEVEKKKPFPWWILLVVLAVLVIGGGLWMLLSGGTPELNEACEEECAAGLSCAAETSTCRGNPGFSGCLDSSDCSPGLSCSRGEDERVGTCVAPLGFEGCGEGDCAPGLLCDAGACRGDLDFAGCTDTADCAGDLLCLGGTCKADTVGQGCSASTDCAEGQLCVSVGAQKICLRRTGEACTSFAECQSLICQGDPQVCSVLPNGSDCQFAGQCQSGLCQSQKCVAFIACSSLRPCPSGMQCVGNRCRRIRFEIPGQFQNQLHRGLEERIRVAPSPVPSPP